MEWVASPAIVDEYPEVLSRPRLDLPPETVAHWRGVLGRHVHLSGPGPPQPFEPDPKDAMLLSCALAAGANFLVTGDRALLRLGKIGDTFIVGPGNFKRLVIDPWHDPAA